MAVKIKDVAAHAGVSVGTVSNVLNGRETVSPAAVERVRAAIESLGYVRNDAARQLRAGRSRSIALIVLDVGNPFFAAVARGAEARAADDGYVVLLGSSGADGDHERLYLDQFREQRVAGVLLTPADAGGDVVERLAQAGIPVVLVDEHTADAEVCTVSVDDVEGGHLAVAHLLAQGRRRIGFVAGPLATRQVADRLAGARRAVAEVEGAALEIIETDGMTVLAGRAAGERLRERTDRPDAVFAANDLLAVGLLQALTMLGGIRVPDDIALVGYDDIDFAAATVVPLTSVRQPAEALGSTAVDLLLRQLDGELDPSERQVRFRPELVVRASSG
ncbi:LacI family DNA-binding transcriptional regulator [Microbacterium sp. KSW2-29]|uniref:LacI family DNA-binding transcriptional regulator n=1 Tax=Microbacterium phycohabitans TaxID=3075993 RepID=A0ABU3SJV0_9MICO|nr:LacI family DNA-binding transcriptional regulator [Microbacterium sp. KSW2-29]MDU0345055.1 LacI family DNA-binding transcriptional regulator [Microbacterium sp. KSW2-29]